MSEHKYPNISGKDLVKILTRLGYEIVHQKGSHIKLKKMYSDGKHIIIVPNHKKIDRGTLGIIIKRMTKNISKEEFLKMLK